MAQNQVERIRPVSDKPFWLVLVAALIVVAAYTFRFFNLDAGDPDSWAGFGDYFGGILNPIVGLVTVLLVLRTLQTTRMEAADTRKEMRLQRDQMELQIKHIQDQAKFADYKRRLDGALDSWNTWLDQPNPELPVRAMQNGTARKSTEATLRQLFRVGLNQTRLSELMESEHRRDASKAWVIACGEGAQILGELAYYCHKYDQEAGNQLLTNYYRRRVSRVATYLQSARVIDETLLDPLFLVPYSKTSKLDEVSTMSYSPPD